MLCLLYLEVLMYYGTSDMECTFDTLVMIGNIRSCTLGYYETRVYDEVHEIEVLGLYDHDRDTEVSHAWVSSADKIWLEVDRVNSDEWQGGGWAGCISASLGVDRGECTDSRSTADEMLDRVTDTRHDISVSCVTGYKMRETVVYWADGGVVRGLGDGWVDVDKDIHGDLYGGGRAAARLLHVLDYISQARNSECNLCTDIQLAHSGVADSVWWRMCTRGRGQLVTFVHAGAGGHDNCVDVICQGFTEFWGRAREQLKYSDLRYIR
ncbi:hypothetical protein Tco_0088125 [Tanacetum coccineum]